jgi:hypothetical protein
MTLRPETLKLLGENVGKTLQYVSIGNDFLNSTPIVQEIIARIDKRDCIKLKKLLYSKGNNYQCEEIAYRMGENLLPAINLTRD